MKNLLLKAIVIFISFLYSMNPSCAQDILGGWIQMQSITGTNGLCDTFTMFLYTDSSLNIQRPTIDFCANGATPLISKVIIAPGIYLSKYSCIICQQGPGNYDCFVQDTYRIADIVNIPNSDTQSISFGISFTIDPILGVSNSPIIYTPLTSLINDYNGTFKYNPNAWDPDGDSLAYSLIPCTALNYSYPPNISINAITGIITCSPDSIGLYAVAFQIDKYRRTPMYTLLIGSTTCEMIFNINSYAGISALTVTKNVVSVYPNPTNTTLNIHLSSYTTNETLLITDVLGEVIYKGILSGIDNSIDVSKWSEGVYFYVVRRSIDIVRGKFVVQK